MTSTPRPHRPLDRIALASCLRPGEWERADLPALLRLLEQLQRLENDAALQLPMKRHAKMMPHHEGDEDRPRWLAVLGDVERHRDGNRWNTPPFDRALNQRD